MDRIHKLTDDKLEVMEKHLTSVYQRAQKEIQKTADDYFSKFAAADKKKKALVDAGKLDKKKYIEWRKNKILYGQRYKQLQEEISLQLLHVNEISAAYINGELPEIYSMNYNDIADDLKDIRGYSFTLTDPETVMNLAAKDDELLPYKYINRRKDLEWNMSAIRSEVLQGILQGESIPKIAKRMENVTERNRTSAIRNARTAVTSAENKGRQDSFEQAENDGVILEKVWRTVADSRTRHWHAELNNVSVPVDDMFSNAVGLIAYPGDPGAHPANVYNCRCTMKSKIKGFKPSLSKSQRAKVKIE